MSRKHEYHEIFIAKLCRVVKDYHAGLVLIDREFDEACERIDLSIAKHGTITKHVDYSKSQESKLRKQSETIERDISKIDDEVSALDQGIAAIGSSIQALTQKKTNLEQQIQDRVLIERIFYLFIEDEDKQHCARLQSDMDNLTNDRSALEETRRKLESRRLQAVTQKSDLQSKLRDIRHHLAKLKKSAESADAQAKDLASKRMEAETRRQSRKVNLLTSISAAWQKATAEITQEALRLRRKHPAFIDLLGSDLCFASEMPGVLLLGEQRVAFKELHCLVPYDIQFPFKHALVLPEDNQAQRRLAHHFLLRLLQALPPGRLELTLIDPLKLGQSFEPFLPLLNVERLMPQLRVLTRADEIERILGQLTDETEDLIQHRFKGRISNWTDFNAENPENKLPYKIVLLFDVPEQLSDNSSWYLQRLAESGPRCGILPIIAVDGQRIEERRHEKLYDALKHSTQRIDALLGVENNDNFGLSYTYQPEEWPQQNILDDFFSVLARHYAEITRFSRKLPNLWEGYTRGITTVGGFDIPIGWTLSGEIVSLTLGATNSEHHALLAGKTGSGKSNLLHVMIHSLCEKYAPQEIDLYLLDYKESTEFTIYAEPALPHARLVATESDPEYGITVLQHLVGDLESRARLFKSAGVRDFEEYRNAQPSRLARDLLIIDEFQVLFTEGRQVAESAEKLLSQLLKQGRSFGIHILLCTQTLKGINALSMGSLISQLGCRIALACGQEDSTMILSGNNWAASDLKSPPEGIINNANGAKSANVRFMIPLAERSFCLNHLRQLSKRAAKRGIVSKARVFNGANLPPRPPLEEFRVICGQSEALSSGMQ